MKSNFHWLWGNCSSPDAAVIRTFREKYTRVSFDVFTAMADLVKEHMEKGLINIDLLLEPVDMKKYEFIRLDMKENWVVLMRPDDPLAEKDMLPQRIFCPCR